jgi:DNA-binding NarL/FixJ family response regulator
MMRVAIVDDHLVARRGLMAMLADAEGFTVVAQVADAAPLLGWHAGEVDIVLCDPYPFGEPPALDALRALAAWVPVVVMSASREPTDVLAALRAGARGYLSKDADTDGYVTALRCVASGGVYLPTRLADLLTGTARRDGGVAVRPTLSEREQEALAYIGRGFTHQQTARRMGVSKATVDTYVGRIRTKLQLGNKAELALAALRHAGPRYRAAAAQSA